MAGLKKKGQSGEAAAFISRSRAIRRLQLSLSDFRRLCILKGVYPRDPRRPKRVLQAAPGRGGRDQTFYAVKDIRFLAHEPLLDRFRQEQAWAKKMRRWRAKGEVDGRRIQSRPSYSLDHIIRERYPTFSDALRDLDDALSMACLFAVLPTAPSCTTGNVSEIRADYSRECTRLVREWEAAVMGMSALRCSFVSIRGIYHQAVVCGHPVTWIVPHDRCTELPSDVDFRVMLTFLELYMTLLRFVNFRLFARLGWPYPLAASPSMLLLPSASKVKEEQDTLPLRQELPPINPDAEHALMSQSLPPVCPASLFANRVFFVGRECPLRSLAFIIQSLGGALLLPTGNADEDVESDPTITHQIVDRPQLARIFADRLYVQPQWVWDCLNAGRLVEHEPYGIGAELPPHRSPFDGATTLVSEQGDKVDEEAPEAAEEDGRQDVASAAKKRLTKEQRQLAASMLSRKQKKVYDRVAGAQARKRQAEAKLEARRLESQKPSSSSLAQ